MRRSVQNTTVLEVARILKNLSLEIFSSSLVILIKDNKAVAVDNKVAAMVPMESDPTGKKYKQKA